LYKSGATDNFVYFILFGRLVLHFEEDEQELGRVNIGWTIGEEVLFDRNMQLRNETCYSETESCLLGVNKNKLAVMQKELLEKGNMKDYLIIESILKGNYLLKQNWRAQLHAVNLENQQDD